MWPIAAWLLVVASAAVLAVGIYGRVLAPSLVLDLVSFWPGLLLALLLALAFWPLHRRGMGRVAAILPLLLLTWMWGGVALHLSEWDLLPSASGDLEGPAAGDVLQAHLSVETPGDLHLRPEEGPLYRVEVVRRAGTVGIPEAFEQIQGGEATVELLARPPEGWFQTSGWRMTLHPGPSWDLEVQAGRLQVDLRGVRLTGLAIRGDGSVALPAVAEETVVLLAGRLVVVLPRAVPAVVEGSAQAPADWVVTDTGWRSPTGGSGYLIEVVEGSQVRIVQGS